MTGRAIALVALVVGVLVVGLGYAAAAADDARSAEALGPGTVEVEVVIRDSRFVPDRLLVHEGTQLRVTVRNEDPINHELVVGDEALHREHETGDEAAHPPVPGEVSLGPLQTGATVIEAADPGALRIVCHLPRHEAYGMVGELVVLGRS